MMPWTHRLALKISIAAAFIAAGLSLASVASAATSAVARVHRIYPTLPSHLVYVDLEGSPQLDGGGCPLYVFVADMNDPNFKTFIFPVLLAAKAADAEVKIIVQGCQGAYPVISAVEYSPA